MFRPDPKDVPEIIRRQKLIVGQPFVYMPNRDPNKVYAVFNGCKVKAENLEMIFNDALLVDFVYRGIGPTSTSLDEGALIEVRKLSENAYASISADIRRKYGTVCLECDSQLPTHTDTCTAGIRNQNHYRGLKAQEN